ncbi:MAG TPA: hypothetical protein VFK02_29120 [Kofleriaceae bacterium]|nr:hypothetical protein [Kofleriaceae bacterium]
MQLEDKLVDGREAARAEAQQREDVLERGEETLPAPEAVAMREAGSERRNQLLGAIRMIFERQTLTVAELHLPTRETLALEALQVATTGRAADTDQFVYATDRRDMLERALAALQPDLIHADDQSARELAAQLADLTEQVAELRHQLTELEDSQDELLEGHQKEALASGAAEPGDKPRPKPKPSDPDAPRPATTLTGPEPPEAAPPATTLIGPEVREAPRPATTLTGPEAPERPRPPTTLTGPELPPEPPAASTLDGPELPPEPAPPSSLDDAADGAARAKAPWWRRPFG